MKLKTIQAELRVSRKEWITPHYIRIFLTGKNVEQIANTTIGVNNKILIPPRGVDKIYFPEFNTETNEWIQPPDEVRPIIRTYTHRGINLENNEVWIDFVAHGEEGPASAWATRAAVGDVLGVLMRDGKKELVPAVAQYLLVGDGTAIPVLGAILEGLPKEAKVICVLEVHDKRDEQVLKTQADVEFIWLHNDTPHQGSLLVKLIERIRLPEDSRFAYIAAEYDTVRAIRAFLRQEKNWQREELYAYAYWKAGVAEDKSSTERRAETEKTT